MNKQMLIIASSISLVAAICQGTMVTERWGVQGHIQHPNTLTYTPHSNGAILIWFDLSALPRDVAVHRARLFFTRPGLYGRAFDIVPGEAKGEDPNAEIKITSPPLQLVPPYFQWFDATAVVRQWRKNDWRQSLLILCQTPDFVRTATYLEVAYEGQLTSPPQQVTGLKAFYRSGQVFITFKEIEDYAAGNEDITCGFTLR